jgi:uncharacterized membrane protein YfcA
MASLFNSLMTPFVIMFTLPMALIGALGALVITGETLSLVSCIGILMLALFVLLAPMNIHEMNAIKTVLAGLINGVASVGFLVGGVVDPAAAAVMLVGGITGGFVGARLARRTPAAVVRRLVTAIGLSLAALLAWRRWG